jgi:hypothetical protein
MMITTSMVMVTAIKFLYCYNFDCFYEGLSPKKDGLFSINPHCIFRKGQSLPSAQKLSLYVTFRLTFIVCLLRFSYKQTLYSLLS